jgi:hypothetical protein
VELGMLPVRWVLPLALLAAGCARGPAPAAAALEQSRSPISRPAAPATESEPDRADLAPPQPPPEPDPLVEAAPPAAPPPLPKGTTVLHIGDSMAGALGIELNEALKSAGVRGILRFKTASFIPTWAWGREISLYVAQYDPDLVLITLGANEVAIKDPEIRAKNIQRLVRRIGDRPCVWIAPPLWAGDTGLLPVIRKNSAPCRYMDTNAIIDSMPRLPDKIHPTMRARKDWAKVVVDWLARERLGDGERPWQLRPE